ncbi:hypothetical protein MXB_942 [Myxobolus squamalis]|nr:hypothetical protein MXB_942 [Myxobolus squamalis]
MTALTLNKVPLSEIQVESEKIDGCDSKTKLCVLKRRGDIQTKISVKAKIPIKVQKQKISLDDPETEEIFDSVTLFCGVPGKPACLPLSEESVELVGNFSLDKKISGKSGGLEWTLFSEMGYKLHTSKYSFR